MTITYRAGSQDPLVFQPVDDAGAPIPLDSLAMQLRIQAGAECIPLTGVRAVDGYQIDLSALTLPPRVYVASEYWDDGAGWRWIADHNLHIMGGC